MNRLLLERSFPITSNIKGTFTPEINVKQLRELIRVGVIKRDTKIENVNGRLEIAGNVKGLEFPPEPKSVPIAQKKSAIANSINQSVKMDWYYYNEADERIGALSVPQVKELVKAGVITRNTRIENVNGKSALAGTMAGFEFPPEAVPPAQAEVYGLTPPSIAPPIDGTGFANSTPAKQIPDGYDPLTNSPPVVPQIQVSPQSIQDGSNKAKSQFSMFSCGGCIVAFFALCVFISVLMGIISAIDPEGRERRKEARKASAVAVESDDYRKSPLYAAVMKENSEEVKRILSSGGVVDARIFSDAVFNGYLDMVELLIPYVDVNAKNSTGSTPLHTVVDSHVKSVASYAQLRIANMLVEKGADVNARDNEGATPLSKAACIMFEYTDTKGNERVRFLFNIELSQFLISKGADVNTEIKFNMSSGTDSEIESVRLPLLFKVCYYGYEPLENAIKLLIDNGANINAKNSRGETVLHCIVKKEYIDDSKRVATLISNGADMNSKDNEDMTPLHWAVLRKNKESAKLFIVKEVDVNAKNNEGMTPLHFAVVNKSDELARILLANGADVNAKNNDGDTVLHLAIKNGHPMKGYGIRGEIILIPLFIDKGADVNATNNAGETLLHTAEKYKNWGVAEYLSNLKK